MVFLQTSGSPLSLLLLFIFVRIGFLGHVTTSMSKPKPRCFQFGGCWTS
jgi:hypothetical protein